MEKKGGGGGNRNIRKSDSKTKLNTVGECLKKLTSTLHKLKGVVKKQTLELKKAISSSVQ